MHLPRSDPPSPLSARTSVLVALVAAGLLVGCGLLSREPAVLPPPPAPVAEPVLPPPAPPPPAPATPPPPDPAALADTAARRVLAYSERAREFNTTEFARETARLGEAPEGPASTLELALLLAQNRQAGDLARAIALLEPLTRPTAPAPWQAAARLLYGRLAEQRRLEEQVERQGLQLRDQQRRIEQLSNQLEALKAIERSLNGPRAGATAAAAASAAKTAP